MDNMHSKQGNVGLADGSVQGFSRSGLQSALQNSGDTGGHGTAGFAVATGCSPQGVNRIQLP
jgi:prepilin-type processing-associated H-X9-DG protein